MGSMAGRYWPKTLFWRVVAVLVLLVVAGFVLASLGLMFAETGSSNSPGITSP